MNANHGCTGNCNQGRNCTCSPTPPEFRSPLAALLTGFVAAMAICRTVVLVGVAL